MKRHCAWLVVALVAVGCGGAGVASRSAPPTCASPRPRWVHLQVVFEPSNRDAWDALVAEVMDWTRERWVTELRVEGHATCEPFEVRAVQEEVDAVGARLARHFDRARITTVVYHAASRGCGLCPCAPGAKAKNCAVPCTVPVGQEGDFRIEVSALVNVCREPLP